MTQIKQKMGSWLQRGGIKHIGVRSEVLTAMLHKIKVFWVMLCGLMLQVMLGFKFQMLPRTTGF